MARRYDKGVSGSVQARNGYLHLVVGYKDPLTQKRKVKWMAMDLPEDSLKSVVEKRKRDMITEFEAKYASRDAFVVSSCHLFFLSFN